MRVVFARGAGPVVVGHRGGRGAGWPTENTMEAFARAHAEGAPAIELDVRVCVGGDVVVLHDPDLARVTGGVDRRAIATVTRGVLARVRLAAGERVPLLDDVLDWARGRVAVNVEAKHDAPDRLAIARGIARVLSRHPDVEILISCFDPVLLSMLAALAPRAPRAWLVHQGQARWERVWSPLSRLSPLAAVHVERTMASRELVSSLHRAGRAVGVWTVNDLAEARGLAALGVDWIVTDAPGAVLAAISRV